jgi:DNA primase
MGKYIPEQVLEEIKFRNDIVEVIGGYIHLKKAGATYKACCPFHKEKTPSFNVNPNLQIFKCFGCGESGNVFSFLMKYQGLDFISAAKTLADRVGISLELEDDSGASRHRKLLLEINHEITAFYQRCLKQTPAAETARQYLENRKLDGEIAETFQLGYAPDGWDITTRWGARHNYPPDILETAGLVLRSNRPNSKNSHYDRFRNRLIFPIHDSQNRVIGFSARILTNDKSAPKYVNSPETPLFHKSRILYALNLARRHIVNAPNREAVICEGQIDVIRCHQHGIQTAIAAQGTAFTPDHAKALKNYADSIVIAFDSDAAGRKAAIKTAIIFMDAGIIASIAELPPGEDPDSYILNNGAKAFRTILDNACSVIAFQIKTLTAAEHNADDVAATTRIANTILQSISHSTNAVQKARLLQEAAKLLNLPEKALEEDLQKIEEEQKKTAARQTATPAPQQPPDDFIPMPEYIETEIIELDPAELHHQPPPTQPTANQDQIPKDEHLLCEHIVHLVDYPELAELIQNYLPLSMISTPKCRTLISTAIKAAQNNENLLEELLVDGEENVMHYAEQLINSPAKVTGREYSPSEAVQDLILKLWRNNLEQERLTLINKGENCSQEERQRRYQLTIDLKSMRIWTTGHEIITLERAMHNNTEQQPTQDNEKPQSE